MDSNFRVEVSKDYLVFASAHFITFQGHQCEALHGHNYRLRVAVEGEIDPEAAFVVDFSIVKKIAKQVLEPIDHKVLLARDNPKLAYREENDQVHVDYFGKAYFTFPKRDCALLPITNTTAEMLAQYLAKEMKCGFLKTGIQTLRKLEVEVEENYGQAAIYSESLE